MVSEISPKVKDLSKDDDFTGLTRGSQIRSLPLKTGSEGNLLLFFPS